MISESTGLIHPVPFTPHELQEMVEAGLVIVEDQHILSCTQQLLNCFLDIKQEQDIFPKSKNVASEKLVSWILGTLIQLNNNIINY